MRRFFRSAKKEARVYPAELQQRLVTELQTVTTQYPGTPHARAALRLLAVVCSPPALGNERLAAESLVQLSTCDPEAGAEPLYEAARLYDLRLAEATRAADLYEQLQSRFPGNPHADEVRERLAFLRPARP
jgi:outer membrane protein assembly factor BamD (BamD/ComL family)